MPARLNETTRAHDLFKAATANPILVSNPPADPYSLLAAGEVILYRDIKLLLAEGEQWVPIESHEIGRGVPKVGIAYARVCP